MFAAIKSQTSLKLNPVLSKTRSLGQIIEIHCVGSRILNFGLILMKLCQNVCLNEISESVKTGHVWCKTRSHIKKYICTL